MKTCPNCGRVMPDHANFCPICGLTVPAAAESVIEPDQSVVQAQPLYTEPTAMETPSVKTFNWRKFWKVSGMVLCLLVIVILVAGLLTNWFGGPLGGLFAAAKRTFEADSMTISLEVDSKEVDGTAELQYSIDHENESFQILLYNGDTTMLYMDESYIYSYSKNWSSSKEETPEELAEAILTITSGDEEKIKDFSEDLMDDMDVDYDEDDLKKFSDRLYKDCLCNSAWLEKCLGFKQHGNTYSFSIDLEDTFESILEIAHECDLISNSEKKSSLKSLRNADLEDIKFEIETTGLFGHLKEIRLDLDEGDVIIEFRDINSTVVDGDEVIDKVNAYLAEHFCDYCGKTTNYEYYCFNDNCSWNKCELCYEVYSSKSCRFNTKLDKFVCVDCRHDIEDIDQYMTDHFCEYCAGISGIDHYCPNENCTWNKCELCERVFEGSVCRYNTNINKFVCENCR